MKTKTVEFRAGDRVSVNTLNDGYIPDCKIVRGCVAGIYTVEDIRRGVRHYCGAEHMVFRWREVEGE